MPPVVPGAFGSGMNTRAAYGGGSDPDIYHINSLADSGAGTLRECMEAAGPRIGIFEISGYINLASDIVVTNPYLTIAGQTAPSPGITIRMVHGGSTEAMIIINTNDVLIQHLRIRPGWFTGSGDSVCNSAILTYGYPAGHHYNVVFDHLSVSWAQDESFYLGPTVENGGVANATVWRCLSAEGLFNAPGSTLLCTGALNGEPANGHAMFIEGNHCDVLQSVFSTCRERNPMADGAMNGVMLNNIIYQWQGEWGVFLFSKYSQGPWHYTVMGNRWIVGPNSLNANVRGVYGGDAVMFWFGEDYQGPDDFDECYAADNTINNAFGITVVPQVTLMAYNPMVTVIPTETPIPTGYAMLPSTSLEAFLLPIIGARPADRDAVDIRLINNIITHQGNYISSVNEVAGGYPTLAVNHRTLTTPINLHQVQPSGYTVMEEWLHDYAADVEGGGGGGGLTDAAGTIFVQDTYTGVNGQSVLSHVGEIGANYTNHATTTGTLALTAAGRLRLNSSALLATVVASGVPISTEYDIEFDLAVLSIPVGESFGVWGRFDRTTLTGYQLYYDTDAALWTLRVAVNGTFTILGTFGQVLTAPNTVAVKFQLRNNAQYVSFNGVLRISSGDTSVTAAGSVGIVGFGTADTNSTGIQLDNLVAQDVVVQTDVPNAAGTTFVRDTFVGTAGTDVLAHTGEIGASYTNHATTTGQFVLSSLNRLRCNSNATLATVLASGTPVSSQYDVTVDFVVRTLVASRSYAFWARLDPTVQTGYQVRYDTDSVSFELYAFVSGVATLIGSYAQVLTTGQTVTVRLKVRNGAQYVSIGGTPRINTLDTSVIVAGQVGVTAFVNTLDTDTTGIHLDNLTAIDVLSGAVVLSGQQATTSIGAVGKGTTRSLSGFGSTSAIGSVSAGNNKTVTLIGIAATVGQGTFGNTRTPASVTGTLQLGLLSLSRVKALAGLATAASLGAISVFQAGTVQLSGVSATTASGTLSHATQRTVSGSAATASRGTVTAFQGGVILSGVTATAGQGLVVTPGAVTLTLDSLFATAGTGFVQGSGLITLDDGLTAVIPNFLTIDGTQKQIYAGWTVTDAANNTGTMRFGIFSADGSYIPALDAEILYFENGVLIFGGNISQVRTGGAGGEGSAAIVSDVTATDFNALATRRFFMGGLAPGTLKHQLTDLVAYCNGATLDPDQVDGPTMDHLIDYTGHKISDIFADLSLQTNYIWEIDYYKVLRMYAPGFKTAPFSITTPNSKAVLDVTVEPNRQNFANFIVVFGKTVAAGGSGLIVRALDTPSILRDGYWELVVNDADNDDVTSLNHLAAAVLAASLPVLKTVKYNTLESQLVSGMLQTITLPGRGIANTCIITEVQRRYLKNYVSGYAVTATEGTSLQRTGWREIIKSWGGAQIGTAVGVGSGGGGGGSTPVIAAIRPIIQFGGSGIDANSSPSAGVWVPIAGGGQSIGEGAIQPGIYSTPRLGNDALVTVRAKVLDAGNTVTVRLYDITEGSSCTGTSAAINTTTWSTVVFGTTIHPGNPHYYEMQMQTSIVGSPAIVTAYLE